MNQKKQTGLTGFQLKLIALCTMFIDHIGAIVLEQGLLPRITNSVFLGVSLDYLPPITSSSVMSIWYSG